MSTRAASLWLAGGLFGLFALLAAVFWVESTVDDGGSSMGWSHAVGVIGGVRVLPVVVLFAVAILAAAGRLPAARFLFVAVAGAGVLMYVSRIVLQVLGADDDGGRLSDFPSGHTSVASAAAAAGVVITSSETSRRDVRLAAAGLAGALVGVMAASRIVEGAHTPVDVFGGIALGLGWTAVCVAIVPPSGERAPTRTWWLTATLIAAGAGFVLLALLYDHEPFRSIDRRTVWRVARHMPEPLEDLARLLSALGGFVGIAILTTIVVVILLRERAWIDLGFLLTSVVGSAIAVALLKVWFDRPRPGFWASIPLPDSASFPSGHATSGIASLGAAAVLVTERLESARARHAVWAATVVIGPAVGLSRVVLNVHFVTDVLAGWCFGLAWLSACLLVRDRLRASG